jgi:hypothetical protein
VLKQRKLEQKMKDLASTVPDDLIEVFEDASGQFSLFKAADGEVSKPSAQAAAEQQAAAVQAATDADAEVGAAFFDQLTKH